MLSQIQPAPMFGQLQCMSSCFAIVPKLKKLSNATLLSPVLILNTSIKSERFTVDLPTSRFADRDF